MACQLARLGNPRRLQVPAEVDASSSKSMSVTSEKTETGWTSGSTMVADLDANLLEGYAPWR